MVYEHRELRALWPLAIYRRGLLESPGPWVAEATKIHGAPLVMRKTGGADIAQVLRAAMGVLQTPSRSVGKKR